MKLIPKEGMGDELKFYQGRSLLMFLRGGKGSKLLVLFGYVFLKDRTDKSRSLKVVLKDMKI